MPSGRGGTKRGEVSVVLCNCGRVHASDYCTAWCYRCKRETRPSACRRARRQLSARARQSWREFERKTAAPPKQAFGSPYLPHLQRNPSYSHLRLLVARLLEVPLLKAIRRASRPQLLLNAAVRLRRPVHHLQLYPAPAGLLFLFFAPVCGVRGRRGAVLHALSGLFLHFLGALFSGALRVGDDDILPDLFCGGATGKGNNSFRGQKKSRVQDATTPTSVI